ncbi:CPBP family intramembrane glutamic endopeptidase [Streptomyces sp. CB01881]|uniref:CPBP family intramembrane glutamic endopeptidase n=1 Tax=Streptomyces sp. CB01881 TaxID=2078691 RepID=UPI000CDC2306|nr:CPBP family intramembrane glutamic endopeptidase [Streptomyces sp. CB01881]AUY47813.1 CPBP family intramembrane metalloprotease [Streptomyces sp. CB01881]TYC76287.1 CPBP family intramembrane metalloprotease [Streptomyces sp. CB01881]
MRAWKAETGVFLTVAFVAAGALGAVQPATGIPPEVVQLTQFGPAAGVLVVALLWPSRIRQRLAGALPRRRTPDTAQAGKGGAAQAGKGRAGRELWMLLSAPLIIALAAGTYALLEGVGRFTDPRTLEHPFALVVVAQLVGACGEEIGWRCLLQPLVRTRFGPVTASALVGLVWGFWHVQVFTHAPAYAAGFLLATVAMSVVLGLGLEHVRSNRLLLAGGFHTLVNLGMLLFLDDDSGAVLPMALFGGACLVAALPWVMRAPGTRLVTAAEHGAR